MESNVRKFQAFVNAARLGSVTQAADAMGCAQPTVSRMLSSLEEDWGMRLFDRTSGSFVLTAEGRQALPAAEEVCRAYERMNSCVDNLKGLRSGSVSIAAPSSVVTWRLAKPLGAFVRDYPGIGVEITETTYREAERLVSKGSVDLGFIPAKPKGEEYHCLPYGRDEIVVVAPKGHFADGTESVDVRDLVNEPFIADTETAPLLQRELRHPVIRCTTSDLALILAMVQAGLGVSLVPSLCLGHTEFDVDVLHLKTRAYRTMYIVRRKDETLSLAASAFLKYLG